jgi:hypothetical protein
MEKCHWGKQVMVVRIVDLISCPEFWWLAVGLKSKESECVMAFSKPRSLRSNFNGYYIHTPRLNTELLNIPESKTLQKERTARVILWQLCSQY